MFGTLQDRLVKELKLAGIATVEAPPTRSSAKVTCQQTTRASRFPAMTIRFVVQRSGDGPPR
jgi:hypothetical protein